VTTPSTSAPATLDAAAPRHLIVTANAPRLIDVRAPGEFGTAHTTGSYNVPLDLPRSHLDELVCRTGQRAAAAEQALVPARWVAAAIGAGLMLAAGDTRAMGTLLAKQPYNRSRRADLDGVVATLAGARP
jgi:rhodanese-related sulfurtransferase